ncbi:MAG: nucleoid-structuring protein H-NS [Mycobacterium sp.]
MKPAKKAPGKKAPAKPAKKAAPAKAVKKSEHAGAKKAAAKKAPAKKAPATSPPAKATEPGAVKPPSQTPASPRIDTNGQLAAAAKDVAAHAKSTVDAARNPLPAQAGPSSGGRSPVPLAVAIAISLLAVLLVRRLRRDDD